MGERFSGDYFDLEYSWKKVKAAEDKLHFFRYHNNADDPSIDRALGLTFAILLIIYFAEFLLRKAKAVSKSDSSQKVE